MTHTPLRETLEYPLPVLSLDTYELIIETKSFYETAFTIKNTGGSTLYGRIISPLDSLTFEPSEWEGNNAHITCRFTPDTSFKPGDVYEGIVIVLSNGGEAQIPVTIKLAKMAISTPEGHNIANLRDFFAYAGEYPAQARRIFAGSDFHMMLMAIGYPYTDAYEMLTKDANRARALDNFFILSGLKESTELSLPVKKAVHLRGLGDNAMVYGNFIIEKSDNGYLDVPVTTQYKQPWLALSSERLFYADFNDNNTAMIKYSIDPLRIKGSFAQETVIIGGDSPKNFTIIFKRPAPMRARLLRESCRLSDTVGILIENQTGDTLRVEVFCKESFIRFDMREYIIRGPREEIMFTVKLSALQSAQMLFRKQPVLSAVIEVKTVYKGEVIRKHLTLTAGEYNS